jgi:hypothetical protein
MSIAAAASRMVGQIVSPPAITGGYPQARLHHQPKRPTGSRSVDRLVRRFHPCCQREVHFLEVSVIGDKGFVTCAVCHKASWVKDLLYSANGLLTNLQQKPITGK